LAIEPDSPEHSRAAAITVKPADDLTGIDFVLPRFQPRTIRGRLIAATGRLPGSVPLQLGAVSPEGSWTAFDAPIDYDEQTGEFEMRNVPPGPYRLIGAAIMAGEIPVLVRDADIEGLVISAATRSTIHGRLTVEGPIDNRVGQGIQVRLIRRDGSPATPLLSRPVAEGEFSVERVFPGEYLVGLSCVSTPCGAYLKQVRFGGVDATREPIVVLANSDSTLDITVSLNGARVQGTVVDEKLRPVPFARIIFMPRLHPDRFDLYLRVSGTESGEFRLDGFTPGDYKIFVWDRETGDEASGDDPPYEDPAFVREHERDGKEAHFNEGANGSITLKVLR
jgi:hypothetical protein